MPYSHHSHSGQFCKHASGSLEEVIQEAIRQGFQLYGLSEHAPRYRQEDLYPEEEGLTLDALSSQFDAFLTEAHRLKDLYAGKITLLVGLETEFISDLDLNNLELLLDKNHEHVEYLVGSVHHVNGIPIDFDPGTYRKALEIVVPPQGTASDALAPSSSSPEFLRASAFLSAYFDAQFEIMRRFHPEVIGHIDLCRLYEPTQVLSDYPEAWEKLQRNVRFAVEYGALFELNAAALRKGWSSSYPGEDVVSVIRQNGGRFALSDDSHGPHAVGLNYHRMRDYMLRVEIKEIWALERTQDPNAGGRYVRPYRIEGEWWENAFWSPLE